MIWKGAAAFSRCKGCNIGEYCSKECQKQAWPSHRTSCQKSQTDRRMLNDEQRELWDDLQRWAARHRTPLYHGMLAAFDLERRPQAHETHWLGVHLKYLPKGAACPDEHLQIVSISAVEWKSTINSCKPFVKHTFDAIFKKRVTLEQQTRSLPHGATRGIGMVVLFVNLEPTGAMVMELPYRIQSGDIPRRVYGTADWISRLKQDLEKVQ
ncbi:hypothetical protein EVJ58_g7635 [Rhodofomes roseus]|uniref:MYND-type domain-containing protein n=1 Tax=Rhodofomes roseus TaxID=34475 RepID=A0A4Y9Y4W0_9APHY|nr:hypothetical protein EVJ58_g7635 [Rhodofomes roseus]